MAKYIVNLKLTFLQQLLSFCSLSVAHPNLGLSAKVLDLD